MFFIIYINQESVPLVVWCRWPPVQATLLFLPAAPLLQPILGSKIIKIHIRWFFIAKTWRCYKESSLLKSMQDKKEKNMVLEVLKKKRINSKNVCTGVVESDTDPVGSGTFWPGQIRNNHPICKYKT